MFIRAWALRAGACEPIDEASQSRDAEESPRDCENRDARESKTVGELYRECSNGRSRAVRR